MQMAPPTERLLCLSILGYRRPGMSEEDYHSYVTNVHGPLVQNLMVRYGMVQYTVVHNTPETRALMEVITGPQFANVADYDSVINIYFRDVEDFARMKRDPHFIQTVTGDHENFADTKRSQMTIGWVDHRIQDGKPVDIPEQQLSE